METDYLADVVVILRLIKEQPLYNKTNKTSINFNIMVVLLMMWYFCDNLLFSFRVYN